MSQVTVNHYLEHVNNAYNSFRIRKELAALLPPTDDNTYPLELIDSTFYANFDALVLAPYAKSRNIPFPI